MNTIIFIVSGGLIAIIVAAKIPGLEHTVRPIVALVFTAITAVLENFVSWSIWLFKVLWGAHVEMVRHLVLSAEAIDPSIPVRELADSGG